MKHFFNNQRIAAPALVIGCTLLLAGCFVCLSRIERPAAVEAESGYILIDPGHGGADGGAVAIDGTAEKDINLKIGETLADFLRFLGVEVQMTRDADISLHSDDAHSIREQKVSDMKNRLKMYESSVMVVSIHQNKFPQTQYSGTQVFYSANHPKSKSLADAIRSSVIAVLQPENTRELKKGTRDIYLLNKTTVPAVIVECGFLSNEKELGKLKSAEYQQQMACVIACGVLAAKG